ncbi:MAG: hypothetical protein QXE78_02175 [Nitrososphaeria archaeon]
MDFDLGLDLVPGLELDPGLRHVPGLGLDLVLERLDFDIDSELDLSRTCLVPEHVLFQNLVLIFPGLDLGPGLGLVI